MNHPWSKKRSEQPQRRRFNAEQTDLDKQVENRGRQLFHRNRTLVGSSSSKVRSANELGGDLRSPRTHVHHLTAHRRLLSTAFLLIVAGACVLTWLLYEFTAGIHVSSTNGVAIDSSRYQKTINDYLDVHPIERFRDVMNNSELTKYLSQTVPEVVDATVNGDAGFATSQFDLTFRRPVASWLIGSKQYYVDDNGVSFQVNYFDPPTVKIVDQSGVPQTTGSTVASSRFLSFIGRMVTRAKADNLIISQAIIPVDTTHQIDVLTVGRKYPVKLSLDRPVGEQVEDMDRAISFIDNHNLHPAYVDVRVSGKAYYK